MAICRSASVLLADHGLLVHYLYSKHFQLAISVARSIVRKMQILLGHWPETGRRVNLKVLHRLENAQSLNLLDMM